MNIYVVNKVKAFVFHESDKMIENMTSIQFQSHHQF